MISSLQEDFDLFGSDDEDDEEKKKVVEERLKAYAEKKAKKVCDSILIFLIKNTNLIPFFSISKFLKQLKFLRKL